MAKFHVDSIQEWQPFEHNGVKYDLGHLSSHMVILNWAACGCKLWDFEIGYHSRNRVDPSSAQAYTWRQRPKNVNG
ncbi:hypothetical protein NLO85_28045, partial [Pseudomonas savastanoi]|nr:hypothetical protein [Pseudomonas savastanoi]